MIEVEALDRIAEMGAEFREVLDTPEKKWVVINGELLEIPKPNAAQRHQFTTLEGFCEYLNSNRSGDGPCQVFAGSDAVVAELDYMAQLRRTATLGLAFSEEYVALRKLMQGIAQKELWRALLTTLDGRIDSGLLMQVSDLNIKVESQSSLQIQLGGGQDRKSTDTVRITAPSEDGKGTQTKALQTQWTWVGRIWEAFGIETCIPLTMEVVAGDKAIGFVFHPRNLTTILRDVRAELVSTLRERLAENPRVQIVEGQF